MPASGLAQLRDPVVPEPADHVDPLHEHLRRLLGDEEARRVADGVAGPPTHAEQLRFRLLERPDVGDVGVAEAIDLACAHHHVAASAPYGVEHAAERDPAFDELVGAADRQLAADEERLAIAHQQIRLERGSRRACRQGLDGAHTAGEDLTVATERFGCGNDDDIRQRGRVRATRCVAHASALHAVTAAW